MKIRYDIMSNLTSKLGGVWDTLALFRHPRDPCTLSIQFENYTTGTNITMLDWKRINKNPSSPTAVSQELFNRISRAIGVRQNGLLTPELM
jgi:hypothetical protein